VVRVPVAVGTEVDRVSFPVERGKVREFARATHDDSARWVDEDAARAEGHAAIPAPLTFVVVAGHHRDQRAAMEALGVDIARIVVGEVAWTYHRPALVGDVLEGRRVVTSVRTREGRQGGAMTMIDLETVWRDAAGEPVVTQRETLIERGPS
jgi:acyl dehydratase